MNYASFIDHTILKPDATKEEVIRICAEAKKYSFASVCVNPFWVSLVSKELEGSEVKSCSVIGFPLGANTIDVKVFETEKAIKDGAHEIDMVINIGELKQGNYDFVQRDIEAVAKATHDGNGILKVIIETCLLTDEEKTKACELSVKVGADFVKTSTGFSTAGATEEDVALMRKVVGEDVGVKASGGIRTKDDAEKMINAGASRIGASAGITIVTT